MPTATEKQYGKIQSPAYNCAVLVTFGLHFCDMDPKLTKILKTIRFPLLVLTMHSGNFLDSKQRLLCARLECVFKLFAIRQLPFVDYINQLKLLAIA